MDLNTLLSHVSALTPFEARRVEAMVALGRLSASNLRKVSTALMPNSELDLVELSRLVAEEVESFNAEGDVEEGGVDDICSVTSVIGALVDPHYRMFRG